MKTNRNKFLHDDSKLSYMKHIAIVVPHLSFDRFLQNIYDNLQPMTIICVFDGKKPKIDGFLYVSGGGSFAKSSNIGIAYAQSLGFSYVCLINDDVEIAQDQIRDLFAYMNRETVLVSPYIFESDSVFIGIDIHERFGYTKCFRLEDAIQNQNTQKNTPAHLGSCLLFQSSFRFDERFPHGMEDIEFSKRIQKHYKTKIVSDVLIVHRGQSTISKYSYEQEKKSLEGKLILFDGQKRNRIVAAAILHVLFRGQNKRKRFFAIRDVVRQM